MRDLNRREFIKSLGSLMAATAIAVNVPVLLSNSEPLATPPLAHDFLTALIGEGEWPIDIRILTDVSSKRPEKMCYGIRAFFPFTETVYRRDLCLNQSGADINYRLAFYTKRSLQRFKRNATYEYNMSLQRCLNEDLIDPESSGKYISAQMADRNFYIRKIDFQG